uniref:Uncharacterized protein AlNc14C132G6984 n=1 Tax=Albugo laibachii Nc14 TaxID=890382 RepID=F0WKD2_9STRA|nr:conserved hypothetical protein [Albugo laibachii Nc14]|eukprot:CCA21736.1 conserved hypothetical protein [Albugo laibachii Nc14]
MSLQRDEFGFVGSCVIISKNEQEIIGRITRYESKWDRYTIYIPKSDLEFYTRGEIIAMHAKFQVIKHKSGSPIETLYDTSSRYVGVTIIRKDNETKGSVKCFLPYENAYVVLYSDGKEEKMEENEIIDHMIAALKGKRNSTVHQHLIQHKTKANASSNPHLHHTKAAATKKRSIRFISGSDSPRSIQGVDAKTEPKSIHRATSAVDVENKQVKRRGPKASATHGASTSPQEATSQKRPENGTICKSIQPFPNRKIASGHLREVLLELVQSHSDQSKCGALVNILKNRDLNPRVSIKRFTEETAGLLVLEHALGAYLQSKSGPLELDRIYWLLKIICMLPVPPEEVVLKASIGPTIVLVAKSNVQEIPLCVRQLALWIKRKWLSQFTSKKRSDERKLPQCGRRTTPPPEATSKPKILDLKVVKKKDGEPDILENPLKRKTKPGEENSQNRREREKRLKQSTITETGKNINVSQAHVRKIGSNKTPEVDVGERGVYGRNQRLFFSQNSAYCNFDKDEPPTSIRSTADTVHAKADSGKNPAGIAKSIFRRASRYEGEPPIL